MTKISKAEKSDPALHMEMEVLRAGIAEKRKKEIEQTDKERRIAECHQFIGRVQATQLFIKTGNVSELMWINDVKNAELYKDLPGIETWEMFCRSIGYTAHYINDKLKNLNSLGAELLETVSGLRVSFRDIKRLRQLNDDGVVTLGDDNTITIDNETIPIDSEHSEELLSAIDKIIEANNTLSKRVEKLEKQKDEIVKEETKTLKAEKDGLVREVKRLKAFEPNEQDREWSVKLMEVIRRDCDTLCISISKFILDPRMKEDRQLQVQINAHIHEAELTLKDLRDRFEAEYDIYGA